MLSGGLLPCIFRGGLGETWASMRNISTRVPSLQVPVHLTLRHSIQRPDVDVKMGNADEQAAATLGKCQV